MKQVLTYISKDGFNDEHKMAVKIQIDNSLRLGWKPEDIILATNFEYYYNGVNSIKMGDDNFCQYHWPGTKIYTIVSLFKQGLIDELCWYHDFDCFQLNPIDNPIEGYDMGFTNYGRMPRLCSASMFFRPTAEDLFDRLKGIMDKKRMEEERALGRILCDRVKQLNTSYCFHKFNIQNCYKMAEKPIKAVHFHLTPDKYDFYVNGNNKLGKVLIPQELITIFNKNGF